MLSPHLTCLTTFAESHLNGEHVHDYHIRLKLDHSLRVLDNAKTIVEMEDIDDREGKLAVMAALYHDVGRFPQYARYGTFKDVDSMNHGRLGVLTLRELSLPGGLGPDDWRTVRAAVGLHNVMHLNPATAPTLKTITNIVRDADKIDIYPILLNHMDGSEGTRDVVIHNLEDKPDRYSESVIDTILAGRSCGYGSLRYANDFLILIIGWIFDLHWPTSVTLFSKGDLLERGFALLPESDKIEALKEKVNIFTHYNE